MFAALLVGVLAIVDASTGDDVVIVPLYVLAPLVAALAASPRATAAVGVLASALAALMLAKQSEGAGQDIVRLATVVFGSFVAVWIAVLRERLRSTAGLLDVIFEHAPVGLALLDIDVRYVRVNDRLAEINGVPGPEHVGPHDRRAAPGPAAAGAGRRRARGAQGRAADRRRGERRDAGAAGQRARVPRLVLARAQRRRRA